MNANNYYLLKAIESLSQVNGRKKLQKLMYLLQFEGLPFDDGYVLHYFGPYSGDLASRVDFLSKKELLNESENRTGFGEDVKYGYSLSDSGKKYLSELEECSPGFVDTAKPFMQRLQELDSHSGWELELVSTMLYWRKWGDEWDVAEEKTAQKKRANITSPDFLSAKSFAKEIWDKCAA